MKNIAFKKLIIISALVITGLMVYRSLTEENLHTSILINSSPDNVWLELVNFKDYGNWSPFIKSIEGKLAEGNKLRVFIQPKGESGMVFTPTVLKANKDDELRWIGILGIEGIFDGEHYFTLEKIKEGKTRLIHGENFNGVLVPILWSLIEDSTRSGFIAHNLALKKLVESKNEISSL